MPIPSAPLRLVNGAKAVWVLNHFPSATLEAVSVLYLNHPIRIPCELWLFHYPHHNFRLSKS